MTPPSFGSLNGAFHRVHDQQMCIVTADRVILFEGMNTHPIFTASRVHYLHTDI